MNNKARLEALDAAGEALLALGEEAVVLSAFRAGSLFTTNRFSIRLELEGTSGIHGSGDTPTAAFADACAKRSEKIREMEVEAEVRAEIERRSHRKAA
jgi:fructose-1-phosphate kinase PfkB-like protein